MISYALHLEVAFNLAISLFLMALHRFLAVRVLSTKTICYDNVRNFVGAKSELKRVFGRLKRRKIRSNMLSHGIQFRHSHLFVSHRRRVREENIRHKIVCKVMKAQMAEKYFHRLINKELLTLLKEIEHTLNCRSLTRVSTDPDGFQTLSPMALLNVYF